MSGSSTGNLSSAARPSSDEVELLVAAYRNGDEEAFNRLFSLYYEDLRELAYRHLRRERETHTLSTTALVHESYLRLARNPDAGWRSRADFFAFASRAMRSVLIDHARRRASQKRGGGNILVTLQTNVGAKDEQTVDLLALSDALDQLGALDPRLVRVVECRFFGGLTTEETADTLGISTRTVERDWTRARTYLYHLLQLEPGQR